MCKEIQNNLSFLNHIHFVFSFERAFKIVLPNIVTGSINTDSQSWKMKPNEFLTLIFRMHWSFSISLTAYSDAPYVIAPFIDIQPSSPCLHLLQKFINISAVYQANIDQL